MRKYGDIKPDALCDALFKCDPSKWSEEQRTRLYNAAGVAIAAVKKCRQMQAEARREKQTEAEKPKTAKQRTGKRAALTGVQ